MLDRIRPHSLAALLPATALERGRLLFLLLAAASAAVAAVTTVAAAPDALTAIAGFTAPALLTAWWIRGWRRGAFPVAAEPVEAALLFATMKLAPGEPFLPLFGLVFRSVYGGVRPALIRYAAWALAVTGAHVPRGADELQADLSRMVGLSLVPILVPPLRNALQGLAASERRLASLVHHSTDVATIVDRDLVIRWQANAVRGVLGRRPDDLVGTPLTALADPAGAEALMSYVRRAGDGPGPTEKLLLRLRHANGSLRSFDVAISDRRHDPGVEGFVLNLRDETERRRLEAEVMAMTSRLEREALHDALTGLPNRRMLFQRLESAIDAAQQRGGEVSLLLIDLDQFKELNDTLGHQAGDELLRRIRPRLTAAVGEHDIVARLGGDEFAIVMADGAGTTDALEAARHVQEAIAQPFEYQGMRLLVRASIGIAVYPEHATDVETLMQRADVAMYAAKRNGASYEVYAAASDGHSKERLSLIGDLPEAITGGQIVVQYQPKFSLASGEVTGAEALVRWQHPEHGLLGPGAFLTLAEHSGLMRPITLHVLDRALEQCGRWQSQGLTQTVAVNLSAPDLLDRALPRQVWQLLKRWEVDPSRLQLEITETIIGADPVRVAEVMSRLRELGVSLSLDDFGTGSSSLGFLRRLPVQELKLDKSFITGLVDDPRDAAIVRTIVRLAHDLGLRTVAEGIETPDVYERLLRLGCDEAQGYLLGRPMGADEFLEVLHADRAAPGSAALRREPASRLLSGR